MWGYTQDGMWVKLAQVSPHPPPLRLRVYDLSTVAFAILSAAPDAFRNGGTLSLRAWTNLTGYKSPAHIRTGLLELEQAGLVLQKPYGSKRRYAGSSLLWHPQILALGERHSQ